MILAPRYFSRLAATVGLFTRYGLGDFADRSGLRSLVPDDEPDGNGASPEKAVAFRERLVELGPAYIKLGQVLSTRPDLLPDSYVRELETLQDAVDPMSFEDFERTIEDELGGRMSKLFESFEAEPLGTASLGQVHAAVIRGDRPVVVKVQRPNIRELLADDVEFFHELASFLTKHTDAGSRVDMTGVVTQLERALADLRRSAPSAPFASTPLDVPHLVTLMQSMQKVANRVFSGLVLSGLIVASALLLPYHRTLGTIGFVIAGVLGMYMVLVILLTDRRDKP